MKYKESKHWQKREQIEHTFLGGYAHDKEFVMTQCTVNPNRFLYEGIHIWDVNGYLQFVRLDMKENWIKLSEIATITTMIHILRNRDESISNSLTGADTTSMSTSIC